ncbi:MAG: endonuclease/exonuclease/phosphatase family protein [Hyphomicrobiales bacterium]
MRLASFNLESLGGRRDEDGHLARRVAALRPQIARLDADILCLQEVNGQKPVGGGQRRLTALDAVLGELPAAGFHRAETHRADGGPADVHNLVVLSRYPILSVRDIRHDFVEAPLYRRRTAEPADEAAMPVEWDRPILKVTIALPDGRVLHLFNVHFRAPIAAPIPGRKTSATSWSSVESWAEGYFIAAMKRSGRRWSCRRAVDEVFDGDASALIAVAGDFNAEEFNAAIRLSIGSAEDTGTPALACRSLIAAEEAVVAETATRSSMTGGG